MKRLFALLSVAVLVAFAPTMAQAQTPQEITDAIGVVEGDLEGLEGADVAEWEAAAAKLGESVDSLKAAAPDVDYSALDDEIANLEAAIAGGDVAEIEAAAAMVVTEAEAVVAAAGAAGDGTPAPTQVDTGNAVGSGSNALLLGTASALFATMTGAALLVRRRLD